MKNQIDSNSNVPKLALTREEAAQALGVHPITISRLTERGLLRPSRATRRPLYPDTKPGRVRVRCPGNCPAFSLESSLSGELSG